MKNNNLLEVILECLELQMRSCKDWHYGDPAYETDGIPAVKGTDGLRELVMRQHWTIFRLQHMQEEGGSPTRIEMLQGKLDRVTEAVNAHMLTLLKDTGQTCAELKFGAMMARMSTLSLETYHLREAAREASHAAAHEPENVRLARRAEGMLEKVGELDTLRIVQGREMLDAILEYSGTALK